MIIEVVLIAVVTNAVMFITGVRYGRHRCVRDQLANLGYTPRMLRLHRDAITLLKRLIHVADLDGEFDQLSAASRQRINRLLGEYRKELNRM